MMPADQKKAKEAIREERANADEEFQKAKDSAKAAAGSEKEAPRVDDDATARFEKVREQRRERVEKGGIAVIEEPDKRVIVRDKDRAFIRHDEGERLGRSAREQRRERRSDGTTLVVNIGLGGVEITSIFNDDGQLVRRSRRDRDREIVLIDNTDFYKRQKGRRYVDAYVDLPPLVIAIPREKYILEYDGASEDDLYDALIAPPLERLERSYSLEEIRQSYPLRERMRRVDLDAVNFAFASWEIDTKQYPKLERIADAIKRIVERNPDEMFMVEGHTDAVGSDIDNLSLSDRRAESVAIVLSETFRVPPENLTTQGYGEEFLKVESEGPSQVNRRVSVRRITPLLSHNQRQSLN
jgi:outer membrane protein OmpA-like peptidoglycan-associated protein